MPAVGLTVISVSSLQAAVLLEHERQQQMAKIHSGPGGPDMGPRPPMMSSMPPGNPMRGVCVFSVVVHLISIAVTLF